jgi:hypothetical protein
MSFKKIQCCNHCTYRLAIFTAKPIATEVFFKSCNWSAYGLAIKVLCGLAIRGSCCNQFTLRVANTECFRLIIYYPLQLQPDSGSSCNRFLHSELQIMNTFAWYCTTPSSCNLTVARVAINLHFRVANTECFLLIIYYPFSCNPIVVRVAIDVHSELQILSAFSW